MPTGLEADETAYPLSQRPSSDIERFAGDGFLPVELHSGELFEATLERIKVAMDSIKRSLPGYFRLQKWN